MRQVSETFLVYPYNFHYEYRRLSDFYLELYSLVPEDMILNIIISNKRGIREIKKDLNRDFNPIVIPGINDIWLRDYMGFAVDDHVVKPIYKPDYLSSINTPKHIENINKWSEKILEMTGKEIKKIDLIWDGGNLVTDGKTGFITDKILSDNPVYDEGIIKDEIRKELKIEPIIIHQTTQDPLGHMDGNLSTLEEGIFGVSSYRKYKHLKLELEHVEEISKMVISIGCNIVEMYDWIVDEVYESGYGEYIPSAKGCYVNFWKLNNTIVLPEYKHPWYIKEDFNEMNREILEEKGYTVKTIDCTALSALGGVLHCISWDF